MYSEAIETDPIVEIVIAVVIMAITVMVGGYVQKVTHFLYPVDFITILACLTVPVQLCIDYNWPLDLGLYIPWDMWWNIPALVGYFVGYIVSGRTKYVMIRTFTGQKISTAQAYVFYEEGEHTYLQEQKNRELLKRLLFGIKHEVAGGKSDTSSYDLDLEADWTDIVKYPLFPEFNRKMIYADTVEKYEVDTDGRMKEYITFISRASGSMVSRTDLIRDFRALENANKQIIDYQNKIFRLQQSYNTRLSKYLSQVLMSFVSVQPGAHLFRTVKQMMAKKEEEDKKNAEVVSNGKND